MRTKKVPTSLRICAVTNRRSRQAIYMRQRPGHAQFEFTDDRLTGNTGKQSKYTKYFPVVKNRSFMRNKGHDFGVRTFTDSKNTLLGTGPEI